MFFGLLCMTYSVLGNQKIEIGETVSKAIMPWHGNAKYELYWFELKEVRQDADLVVVVKQQSALGNPDIYISSKLTEPNVNTAEQICDSVGMDICVIENPQKGPYYLAVQCDSYCRYSLKVVYQSELVMSNSDDLEFKYDNNSWTDVIRIETKNLTKDETQTKPTLEIQVRVKNIEILQESFKSYLNIGTSKPTSQKQDYIGQDTFSGMQKFKIHNIEPYSVFTLLVEGQEGLIVQIQTRTYGTMRYLQLGDKVEDIVAEDDYQFYCIDLTQDASSILSGLTVLNIQLLPFKGFTEMFVNLDYQPPFLDQYQWQLTDRITDDLVISKADLFKYNSKATYAYVAVRGKESNATFELKSQIVDPNFMLLELNKPTTAKLSKDSFIQYKFYIRNIEKQTVSVSLKNIKGDADIILKQCETLWNCAISKDDINSRAQRFNSTPGGLFFFSDKPGNDIIVFDNNPEQCQKYDNTFQCFYDVMIYPGQDNTQEELIYSILITSQGESTLLRENTPLKQFVGLGLENYYKFKVEEQDYIRRMMIQVTPIQGQPKIFASKTNKTPNQEDKQGVQNVITYGLQGDQEAINGVYYITVKGYTACQYIITVYIFRNRGDWSQVGKYPHQYILLLDGYPQEITSQNNSDVQLFKVDLSAYYNPEQTYHYSVDVKLRVIQGSFLMYGFDHPEIDKTKAFVNGTDFLSIGTRSQIYPQYLYIRVEASPILSSNQLSYQIYYRINNQPIELILGDNYRGYINKDDTQTFFLSYFKKDELLVTKNVEYYDESILQARIYVGNQDYQMTTSSQLIKEQDLQYEKCKTNATEIVKCQITIMVSASQDTYFSLLISKESSIVFLYDAEPVTKPLSNKADHYLFFLSNQETEISVFSISGEVQIYLQIFNQQPLLEQFPTNNSNSVLQSLDDQNDIGSSIFISKEFLESNQCLLDGCYIAVTCIKDPKYDSKGTYVITRSSSYQTLYPSIIYYGDAEKMKIKYFKISNVTLSSGLMVIVSPLSSGSLIVLASQNEMPTLDTYQYSSNTMIGDQLIIPSNSESTEAVNYYVGVYAFEDVKFSIQINFGDLHFYQLKKAVPMNFFAEYNSETYLNYYHAQDSEFTILFSSNLITQYNRANVHVLPYKEMNMQAEAIKQVKENPKWKMSEQFLHIKKNIHYCTSCYYLIYVQNFNLGNDISITISLENESTQLLDNVEITNQIESNSIHYYHYLAEDDFYFNATIYEGEIQIYGGFFKIYEEIDQLLLSLDILDGLKDEDGKVRKPTYGEGLFPNKTVEIMKNKSEEAKYIFRFKIISNSNQKSTYKIECIQKQQAIELKLGEPQALRFNSTLTVPFYFFIPERHQDYENQEGFYTLDIETYGHSFYRIQTKTQHPFIKLNQDLFNNPNFLSDYHNYQEVQFLKFNQTDQIIHFEFSSIPGLYFLEITPRESSNLPYTITLGNDFLNILAPKLSRYVSNKIGQQRFWEINVYQPSTLLIQAQLCGGIMSVYGSDNIENLQKGSYIQKMEYKHNKQIIGTIPVSSSGPYYLSTKATKSLIPQNDYLDYILKVNILQQSSIVPYEKFEPGDGGEFSTNYDGEFISVFYSPIQVSEQSSSDYKILTYSYNFIYKLYNLTDEEIPLYHCDSSIAFPSKSYRLDKHQKLKELNHSFTVDQSFQKIALSILAKVKIYTKNFEEITLYYYYDTITMKVDNVILQSKQRGQRRLILFGIISILLLAIVCLFIRNRKLKQIIRFESTESGSQQLVRQEQSIEMNYTSLH
ncbi:unnamed protein product [Paramecium sonneborni]|uniref:Transmembrane protein n=1 Tax=Paramecium sonneborni TaxID=65129 RepID=A0A8S1Q4T5_9CILI|nr:unnamed protein product [Paramecium sonneborni]